MASYTVSYIKFVRPQPELIKDLQTSTILGPWVKGWSATVNEDTGVVVVKVRKVGEKGPFTESVRYAASSIDNYKVTAAKPLGDEPADPK